MNSLYDIKCHSLSLFSLFLSLSLTFFIVVSSIFNHSLFCMIEECWQWKRFLKGGVVTTSQRGRGRERRRYRFRGVRIIQGIKVEWNSKMMIMMEKNGSEITFLSIPVSWGIITFSIFFLSSTFDPSIRFYSCSSFQKNDFPRSFFDWENSFLIIFSSKRRLQFSSKECQKNILLWSLFLSQNHHSIAINWHWAAVNHHSIQWINFYLALLHIPITFISIFHSWVQAI